MFDTQLREIVDVRAVHDFAAFLQGYRPKSADKHIRKQFSYTFEARDDCIFVQTKKSCAAVTAWGPWTKILPYPDVAPNVVHDPSVCPPVAASKPWPELQDNIAPRLRKFYEREFAHPVVIDDLDVEDMRPLHITHTHSLSLSHLHTQHTTCTHSIALVHACVIQIRF